MNMFTLNMIIIEKPIFRTIPTSKCPIYAAEVKGLPLRKEIHPSELYQNNRLESEEPVTFASWTMFSSIRLVTHASNPFVRVVSIRL